MAYILFVAGHTTNVNGSEGMSIQMGKAALQTGMAAK
jgi:hypothetical protein